MNADNNKPLGNDTIKNQTVLIVDCGISVDKAIKKLYKPYGDSMLIMQHNRIDPIKDQIKEMTNLIEQKVTIFCVILGDNYSYIMQDILDLIPMTVKIIWYITEANTKEIIKFLDKNNAKNLIIFDDLMRVVKAYN
jgi:hypothetical protein